MTINPMTFYNFIIYIYIHQEQKNKTKATTEIIRRQVKEWKQKLSHLSCSLSYNISDSLIFYQTHAF